MNTQREEEEYHSLAHNYDSNRDNISNKTTERDYMLGNNASTPNGHVVALEDLDHKFEDIDSSRFDLAQNKGIPDGESLSNIESDQNVKFKNTPNILIENTPCSTDNNQIERIIIPNESSLPESFAINCDEYFMPDTSNGQNSSNSGGGKENINCEATLKYSNLNVQHIRHNLPNIESNFQQYPLVAATPSNYATHPTTDDTNINYAFDKNTVFPSIQNNNPHPCLSEETRFSTQFQTLNLKQQPLITKNEKMSQSNKKSICKSKLKKNKIKKLQENKGYQCELCFNFYSSRTSLNSHLYLTHERCFLCPTCPQSFYTKSKLQKHEVMHDKSICPFECQNCMLGYKTISKLNIHIRNVHSGKKSFSCKVCKKQFLSPYQVRVHRSNVHDISNYKCQSCPKIFLYKSSLEDHVKIKHSDSSYVYQCPQCNSTFTTKNNLDTHRKGETCNKRCLSRVF